MPDGQPSTPTWTRSFRSVYWYAPIKTEMLQTWSNWILPGSLNNQQVLDYVFQLFPKAGPFPSGKDFNDWFSLLPQSWLPLSKNYKDPYRSLLPDCEDIKFTHGDLHRGNIIISSCKPARILAIVDWEQAGWYPDYWEYCKALYTCSYEDEWRRDWVDNFLSPRLQVFLVFSEYIMAMGSV